MRPKIVVMHKKHRSVLYNMPNGVFLFRTSFSLGKLHIDSPERAGLSRNFMGVSGMILDNEERPRVLARWLIERKSTVRSTAKAFGISKSTVHKDVTSRLKRMDPALYDQVRTILGINKSERHLRGGHATKLKYQSAKSPKM